MNSGIILPYTGLREREALSNAYCKTEVLKDPRRFNTTKPLENDFLEDCIQKNIIAKYQNSKIGTKISNFLVTEVRAFIYSLSNEDKVKLSELVSAFTNDKDNLKKVKGIIFSGGEVRVVPEIAAGMTINVIALLSGMKTNEGAFNTFSGTSAGVLPAAGFAFNALNSCIFKAGTKTDFKKFYLDGREAYEDWINSYLRNAYKFMTGKGISTVQGKHLKELGNNLEILVGKFNGNPASAESFMVLREVEKRYGLNPDDFELAQAAAMSANLVGLFFHPFDLTFGNCFLERLDGGKDYILDPGINSHRILPLDLLNEDIEAYKKDLDKKPGLYFLIGNKKVDNKQIKELKGLGGNDVQGKFHMPLLGKIVLGVNEIIDEYLFNKPHELIEKLGAKRAYVEVSCAAIDPFSNDIAKIISGDLGVSTQARETLISANIPTSDFRKDSSPFETVLDQLHSQLTDPLYISSNGKQGKSPYELYLDDIDRTITRSKETADPWSAKKLFLNRAAM